MARNKLLGLFLISVLVVMIAVGCAKQPAQPSGGDKPADVKPSVQATTTTTQSVVEEKAPATQTETIQQEISSDVTKTVQDSETNSDLDALDSFADKI